jgi:hypothetical protein
MFIDILSTVGSTATSKTQTTTYNNERKDETGIKKIQIHHASIIQVLKPVESKIRNYVERAEMNSGDVCRNSS